MRNQRARALFIAICIASFSIAAFAAAASIQPASANGQSNVGGAPVRLGPRISDRHVVIVVWDGMRPDFVSEQNTPALWKLAQSGVTFQNHHPVYPSATVVNGTAIATGVYPNRSGIIANHDYLPGFDLFKTVEVERLPVVRQLDKLSDGKYIAMPTLPELVQRAGGTTAISAAKGVGLMFDRRADGNRANCVNIFEGDVLPSNRRDEVSKLLGPFPELENKEFAHTDAWTTRALTDLAWKDQVPTLSLLWLSEPDGTQHSTAPGSPAALAAMKSSDDNLEKMLAELDRHHARETTDVFVVSDHGFSTIEHEVELPRILREAGFDAVTEFTGFANDSREGKILLSGNGGTVLFYVMGHDPAITRRLVEFLQQSDFAGVIFTLKPMDGTFALDKVKIDSHLVNASLTQVRPAPRLAPDVVMAFRWNENKNQFGAPGMIDADWQRAAGKGTHATLSKFDMHNTLIAAGPDFQKGQVDELASGNIDLAPTILNILGIKSPTPLDGRVLSEALANSSGDKPKATTETIESNKKFPNGTWHQTLQISRVGSTVYFDQGNGSFSR